MHQLIDIKKIFLNLTSLSIFYPSPCFSLALKRLGGEAGRSTNLEIFTKKSKCIFTFVFYIYVYVLVLTSCLLWFAFALAKNHAMAKGYKMITHKTVVHAVCWPTIHCMLAHSRYDAEMQHPPKDTAYRMYCVCIPILTLLKIC